MSVTAANEQWDIEGSREPGKQNRKRFFQVFTSDEFEDQNIVLSSVYVPQLRSAHPADSTLICKKLEAKLDKNSSTVWYVVADYETVDTAKEDDKQNPTQRRWEVEWETVSREVPLTHDVVTGVPVTNSAGDSFDPPPLVDRSHLEVRLTKSFISIPTWIWDFADSVNEAEFDLRGLTIPAGAARITKMRISDEKTEVQDDGSSLTYYQLTINMTLLKDHEQRDPDAERRAGHLKRLLDEGVHELYTSIVYRDEYGYQLEIPEAAIKKRDIYLNDDPEPVQKPVMLDGAGHLLALDVLLGTGITDGPVSLYFNGYTPRDYSELGLPES